MKNRHAILMNILLAAYFVAASVSMRAGESTCTRNNVGNSLMESLQYMASNNLLGAGIASTTFTGTTLNLVPNGDFEKDLSGLTLQYTGGAADFQCICSGTGSNCNHHAICNASSTSPASIYYSTTNFTDMMGYLGFTSQLRYSWDWPSSNNEYFAIRNASSLSLGPDHTSSAYSYGGQAMLVNGPTKTSPEIAWQRVFSLLPNRTYQFTYWFKNLTKGSKERTAFGIPQTTGFLNLSNLQLDGAPYTGSLPYQFTDLEWHQFSGTVTTSGSSPSTTIAIYVYNDNEGANPTLIAYDDISMVQKDSCGSANWCQVYADHIQISLSVPTLTGGCTQCGVTLMRKPGDPYYDFSQIINITNLRPDPNYPGSRNAFLVDIETADLTRPGAAHLHTTMSGFYDCDYLFDCPPKNCCVVKGDIVNPFVQGLRGNWKANKAYLYNATRQYDPTPATRTHPNEGLYVRQSGIYDQYSDFWHYNASTLQWDTPTAGIPVNWTWKAEVTKMNPYGADVENRDPLYRYSTAIYGYNYSAAIAVGNNTRYRQIAYDGFEDYDFFDPVCEARHFNIESPTLATRAHTGLHSLWVKSGAKTLIDRKITPAGTEAVLANVPFGSQYTVSDHDMLGVFTPDDNNDYVLSFWTYEALPSESAGKPTLDASYFDYPDPHVNILVDGTAITPLSEQHGKVIDRWQQITYTFHIPNHGSTLELQYLGEMHGKNLDIYYDDVRVYPIKATMKSYVYNPVTLKLMAELDENNYATLYEYDLEGKLSRVKKETEKGIYSIQESRTSMPKQ